MQFTEQNYIHSVPGAVIMFAVTDFSFEEEKNDLLSCAIEPHLKAQSGAIGVHFVLAFHK